MAPQVPTKCSSSEACANGEFDADCTCRCHGSWTGKTCSTCASSCQSGGTLDSSTCTCSCASGYFGSTCQDFILARWHSKNGDHADFQLKWKLSDYHSGSYFTRFAGPLGTGTPQIGGTKKEIDAAEGSLTVSVGWFMTVKNYPEGFFYALQLSLGKNEFGGDRGIR